jgi:hypothetical protein
MRLRKMALILWENDSLSSSPAVPGIARAVLATMSAPRHGLVEPLTECRLRDFQTIPLGRSVQSSPLLIAGFPGPSPCDLRASLVFLVSTHWYYTGTRFRGQLPRTSPPPLLVLLLVVDLTNCTIILWITWTSGVAFPGQQLTWILEIGS